MRLLRRATKREGYAVRRMRGQQGEGVSVQAWREGVDSDALLTDDELLDMIETAFMLPSLRFDFKRAYGSAPLAGVTIERVLIHHAALVTRIDALLAEIDRLTKCECGRELGPGKCGGCDNDD
jgi:hypothetical protein